MWKQAVALSLVLTLSLFLLPLFLIKPITTEGTLQLSPAKTHTEKTVCYPGTDESVHLQVELNGEVKEMTLKEYLTGVVRAEMPADFPEEALKAQAVAARSYTLYQLSHKDQSKHASGAALCGDSKCCQAFIAEEKAKKNWGEQAEEKAAKTAKAIAETDGVVALYEDKPILAAFHSSAAGATEDAAAAWSSAVPYLVSVATPETVDTVPRFSEEVRLNAKEFRSLLLAAHPEAKFPESLSDYVQKITRDEAGYVATCSIGGVELRGVEVRRIYSLRSACFDFSTENGEAIFRTRGYGHGVGMSQYGAELMAQQGKDFTEIICHYYSGVSLGKFALEENK